MPTTTNTKHITRYSKKGKGFKWTIEELKSIPLEWDGDFIADSDGLTGKIKATKAGASVHFSYSFKLKNEVTGKRQSQLYYCGSYPTSDISTIRANRDNARRLINDGIDPRIHKVAKKIEAQKAIENTIKADEAERTENKNTEELYLDWISSGVNRSDKNANLKLTFNKHVIPAIGKIKVRDLTEKNILELLKSIINDGKARTGEELYSSLRQMFAWAEKGQPWRRLLAEGNPTSRLEKKHFMPKDYTGTRARILKPIEIHNLYNKLIESEPLKKEHRLAIWICLGTLCRIGELTKAKWSHIDLERHEWLIPKENTKTKLNDHHIYISHYTMLCIRELHDLTGHTQWLFPSTKSNSHITEKVITRRIGDKQVKFSNLTCELQNRKTDNSLVLGDEKWTPHDLRRTGSTLMQQLKISREIINLCQNHVVGSQVDQHYLLAKQHRDKKDAWIALNKAIEEIIFSTDTAELKKFEELKYVDELDTENSWERNTDDDHWSYATSENTDEN